MVEITKQQRADAVASLQRYFRENMPDEVGELAAGLLLNYFIEEVGPLIYNKAISDAQTRMQQRVADLEGELFEDAFQYWPKQDRKRKPQR